MTTETSTNVSAEVAKIFPNLRFLPGCYFGYVSCDLRKWSDNTCVQMEGVKGITMSDVPGSHGHRELTDIRPMPLGCEHCLFNRSSKKA